MTGRSGCGRPDALGSGVRSSPERFQSGASATGHVRSMMTGLGLESDQRTRSNGRDDRTRPIKTTCVSGQWQKAGFHPQWLLSPLDLLIDPLIDHLMGGELRKYTKSVDTLF